MRQLTGLSPLAKAVAAACAAAALIQLSCVTPASAEGTGVHRFVWHGQIDDEQFLVRRANSGGDVARMPAPFTYEHAIHVEFEYVQEIGPNGSQSWPKRHLSWTLKGSRGDDTFTETCQGQGALELGGAKDAEAMTEAQHEALQPTCKRTNLVTAFRPDYELLPPVPLPRIPAIEALDENCAYRKEEGSRRTSIWLTPDVDAVVEMDTRPESEYGRFVPEPGKTVELKVRTVPAYPARFRFVIDGDRTSHFFGYAGNATIQGAVGMYGGSFFKRYHLEHLEETYTDTSPDLIFDPRMFERRAWSRVDQDVVETASEGTTATALVSAMDYGAIGKVRVYAKYKCGGWTPAKILVGGKAHDAVSVPLDEDNNLMADVLEDYKGDSGRDDDAEPEGDGTKGDGLTAFEEYRGFVTAGEDCSYRGEDVHRRTKPKEKNLFVAVTWPSELSRTIEEFGVATGLSTVVVCGQHLSGRMTFTGYAGPPSETRIVNFTLQRAKQFKFDGQTISLGAQHGVLVKGVPRLDDLLGGMEARAVPVTEGWAMGPPVLTSLVAFNCKTSDEERRFAIVHELGHAVGIPHHSDTRVGWRLQTGVENVIPEWSVLQAAGISLQDKDAEAFFSSAPSPELLLVEPGENCGPKDPAAAYREGQFAGCLTFMIVRRGQQHSGSVSCPMRYHAADFYEPPNGRAAYGNFSGVVTDAPNVKPEAPETPAAPGGPSQGPTGGLDDRAMGKLETRHTFYVDLWVGDLRRWPAGDPPPSWGRGKFCDSTQGTEVNAPSKPDNLSGDAGRKQPCRSFIIVNDLAPHDTQ